MSLLQCTRAAEVREVLARGHWPEACPEDLRAHVKGCRRCGDVVLVSGALRQARATSMQTEPIMSPSLIWWRAQLRQRQVSVEKIGRPILQAQMLTLIVALVVGVWLAFEAARTPRMWQGLLGNTSGFTATLRSAIIIMGSMPMIASMVFLALMGMAVVYAAFGRDS